MGVTARPPPPPRRGAGRPGRDPGAVRPGAGLDLPGLRRPTGCPRSPRRTRSAVRIDAWQAGHRLLARGLGRAGRRVRERCSRRSSGPRRRRSRGCRRRRWAWGWWPRASVRATRSSCRTTSSPRRCSRSWSRSAGESWSGRCRSQDLAGAIGPGTKLVATSLVQMQTGRLVDLAPSLRGRGGGSVPGRCSMRHRASRSCRWRLIGRVDYLVCAAYKHLLCPRGVAFLYVREDRWNTLEPLNANWRSADRPFERYFGGPLHARAGSAPVRVLARLVPVVRRDPVAAPAGLLEGRRALFSGVVALARDLGRAHRRPVRRVQPRVRPDRGCRRRPGGPAGGRRQGGAPRAPGSASPATCTPRPTMSRGCGRRFVPSCSTTREGHRARDPQPGRGGWVARLRHLPVRDGARRRDAAGHLHRGVGQGHGRSDDWSCAGPSDGGRTWSRRRRRPLRLRAQRGPRLARRYARSPGSRRPADHGRAVGRPGGLSRAAAVQPARPRAACRWRSWSPTPTTAGGPGRPGGWCR